MNIGAWKFPAANMAMCPRCERIWSRQAASSRSFASTGANGACLSDLGYTTFGGKFLKLQHVVARHDAVGRACQFDHPCLVLEVGRLIGLRKRRAGLVLGEVAVEIAIVGGQNKGGISVHAQIL